MPDWSTRSNVTKPTNASVDSTTTPNAKNVAPIRVAAAINPSATSPADTEPRNIVARPVDSAIVAARAPCRVKCSVVTNVTAADRGSSPPAPALALASLLIAHHLARRPRCDYRRYHVRSGLLHDAPV